MSPASDSGVAAAPPADATERARVADELRHTLFVGAGAGTGKTTALVGRIVRLVLTGQVELRAVAAITFTESAAAELRDRLREAFERVVAGETVVAAGPGATALVPGTADQQHAAVALAEVDQATLTTLHGFAQRILVAHAVEAGLPPRIQVLGEQASLVDFSSRWDDFLRELLDDPALEVSLTRAFRCGWKVSNLRWLAVAFNASWDLVERWTPTDPGPPPPIDVTPLLEALLLARGREAHCTDAGDKLLLHLESLHTFIDRISTETDPLALLELARDQSTLTCSKGQKGNWGGTEAVTAVRDLLAEAEAARTEVWQRPLLHALRTFLVHLRRHTLDTARARQRAGTLEFHDLLVLALELVRDVPGVIAQLRARYQVLLIDEFQDTDPIQAELAMRIAGDGEAAHWLDLEVEAGRLFFVGDPKQSIYRFRRADIGLYLSMRDRLADRPVSLTTCFRSVPGIVDWVNEVFGARFGDGEELSQPRFEHLTASRPVLHGPPAVVALGGPTTPSRSNGAVDEVRAAAADEIVRLVRQAVAEGWTKGDAERRSPLRFDDVAILIPTRTSLPALQEALDAGGVPYRLESRSLVFSASEVTDIVAVLRAVNDPGDDLAVVAALRTPLYGCGDDDLVAWSQAGQRWNYTRPRADHPAGPVADALAHLSDLHDDQRHAGASRITDRVIHERHALALALDRPRPRDAWRRVQWLADQARVFVENGGGDLRGWLAWIDVLSDDEARTTESNLPEVDDDAVRILTVHGSKGLEFPMVVLAGLEATGSPNVSSVLWGPDGPEASVGRVSTDGYRELAADERRFAEHEADRLRYVAATRAMDHLVVPLHHVAKDGSRGGRSFAEHLWNRREELAHLWRFLTPPAAADLPSVGAGEAARPDEPLTQDARDRWAEQRAAAIARSARPSAIAPTALAAELSAGELSVGERGAATGAEPGAEVADDGLAGPPDASWADDGRTSMPAHRGRGGTALGRAVHAVLQVADLGGEPGAGGEPGLEALSATFAAEEHLPDGASSEVARLARHALASPTVRLAGDHRHWRELYVATPVGHRLLEGFVDLLIETPEGLTVVDYKTALGADAAELERRAAVYRPQGVAYALAVGAVVGRPVERCVFVFLTGQGAVEHEVPDLPEAVSALAHALTAGETDS